MKKNKTLIFVTSMFPFGTGETFIENEFPFLVNAFDQIIIITNKTDEFNCRIQPNEKIIIVHFPYEISTVTKIISVKNIFSKKFIEEIRFIKKEFGLKISLHILKTCLTTIQKAGNLSHFITKTIEKNVNNENELYLYSYWMNDMATGIAEFSSKNSKAKSFARAHGWDVYMDRHTDNYLPLRNYTLKNLKACFPISEHGSNYLNCTSKSRYSNKIFLSRLGTFNDEPWLSEIESNTILNTPFHIVSCSNLIPLKRIHLLIKTLHLLDFRVHWTHFGTGQLREELEDLAKELLSPKSNISHQFMGQVSNSEIKTFYRSNNIDLFVNVSETEGVPVSLMEAMSYGIPCLATNVGGNSEIVNSTNGILLPTHFEIVDIKNNLLNFSIITQNEKNNYRKNARNTWENFYNAKKNYNSFLEFIYQI